MQCGALERLGTLFDDRCLDGHEKLCGGRVRTMLARLWYHKYHPKEDASIHQFMGTWAYSPESYRPKAKYHCGENVLTVFQVSK
jgi:hypothetical protein